MSDGDRTDAPPPKVDPETLALRGRPPRVVRFRRGLIAALAGGTACALAGIAWLAFQPATFRHVVESDDADTAFGRPNSDALARAPADYAQVPRLGPPLPGDLGRPILAHEREQAALDATPSSPPDPAAQQAASDAERARAARDAANLAPVLMTTQRGGVSAGEGAAASAAPVPVDAAATAVRPGSDEAVDPHRIADAPSPWVLSAGSIVAAALITGLNSDQSGTVTAQVSQNVYDSPTGRILLVPQGTRIIGTHEASATYGQTRALVVWQRLVFPDGASISLEPLPGSDATGQAGLADRVDSHFWQLAKGAVLASLVGVGSELSINGGDDLSRAIARSLQQTTTRAGEQLVGKALDIKPTIRVRRGWPVRVLVRKDLVLRPWDGRR